MEESIPKKTSSTSVFRYLAYFIIYSFLGWAIETTFAFLMYGVIESRQSFLYGPFCSIYGVGAVALLAFLKYFDKNNYTLFIAGFIIGSIVEYIISWSGEVLLDTRWWDYSNHFLNINGRVCFSYSVFWGALGVFLIRTINPKVDKMIDWIKEKYPDRALKTTIIIISIILILDCIYSGYAEDWVLTKVCIEKDLAVIDKERMQQKYDEVYSNESFSRFVDKYWSIEKVLYSYPNLTKKLENGKRVYIKKLYPEIHPYLIKIKKYEEGNIYEP